MSGTAGVRALETPGDWATLFRDVGGTDMGGSPLRHTLDYASAIGARSCVIDCNYVDADYRDEFTALYSTTFVAHSNMCMRVLFFTATAVEVKQNQRRIDRIRNSYLGFTVLRPPEIGKVGRTLLKPPPPVQDDIHCYPVCTGRIPMHFGARELYLEGTPFISQDAMVMTCAQCAIWVAITLMSPELGRRHAFPYEITSAALRVTGRSGRTLPSTGLIVEQMLNALVELGYNPIFLWTPDTGPWNPLRLASPYIESGIPVIALVPGHAITITGHLSAWSTPVDMMHEQRYENSGYCEGNYPAISSLASANWTSGFLVQDDNLGPYSVLPTEDYREDELRNTQWKPFLVGSKYEQNGNRAPYRWGSQIRGLIIPTPGKVYLTAENCTSIAMGILRTLAGDSLSVIAEPGQLDAWRQAIPLIGSLVDGLALDAADPVVMRLYLERSAKYKACVPSRMRSLPKHVVRKLVETDMPRYVWVAELSTRSLFSSNGDDRQALGEIVFDCTANPHSSYPWVVLNFPGLLARKLRNMDIVKTSYPQASTFPIYVRSDNC